MFTYVHENYNEMRVKKNFIYLKSRSEKYEKNTNKHYL